MRSFIDTNVLVYADTNDEPSKRKTAATLIAEHLRGGTGVVSTQVLHEYVNAAVRKLHVPLETVRQRVHLFSRFQVVNATAEAVPQALDLHVLHQVSFWDALILQAARQSGCEQLLSEDLNSGATLAGVRIVNPFLSAAAASKKR